MVHGQTYIKFIYSYLFPSLVTGYIRYISARKRIVKCSVSEAEHGKFLHDLSAKICTAEIANKIFNSLIQVTSLQRIAKAVVCV